MPPNELQPSMASRERKRLGFQVTTENVIQTIVLLVAFFGGYSRLQSDTRDNTTRIDIAEKAIIAIEVQQQRDRDTSDRAIGVLGDKIDSYAARVERLIGEIDGGAGHK